MSVDGVPAKAPDDGFITQPKDSLVCMQWYHPLLDKLIPSPDSTEQTVIMLYALVTKSHRKMCGVRWIDVEELQNVVSL